MRDRDATEEAVRDHYAAVARRAANCCPPEAANPKGWEGPSAEPGLYGASRYDATTLAELPEAAVAAAAGCANPVALADVPPGEVVIDLGSGGGIDALLVARQVGPTGQVYGIDMTPEMLDLARANQAEAGVTNVEFLEGQIEAIPLPDGTADAVVSNCVISLSTDKAAASAEAYRVLRPGGRLAIADVVADRPSQRDTEDTGKWVSCVGGAITRDQYRNELGRAGFVDIRIDDSHSVGDGYSSVLIRASRPGADT